MNYQDAINYVQNQHTLVDETLAEHSEGVTCSRGCGKCCSQRVAAHYLEGVNIVHWLYSTPAQKDVDVYRLLDRVRTFEKPPRLANGWDREPCLFLKDGACSIYPVRPLNCRVYASLSPPSKCFAKFEKRNMRHSRDMVNMFFSRLNDVAVEVGVPKKQDCLELTILWAIFKNILNLEEKGK